MLKRYASCATSRTTRTGLSKGLLLYGHAPPDCLLQIQGCIEKEIVKGERYWKQKYPPTYRVFLTQQNGWLRFGAGWSLVGAPRPENSKTYAEVEKAFAQLPVVTTAEERTALAEQQKNDPRVILPTDHIALATDFNYGLLVFDRYRIARSGEPEIAWVRHGIHIVNRWKNFEEFLVDISKGTEKSLAKLEPTKSSSQPRQSPSAKKTTAKSVAKQSKSAKRR